MNYKPSLDSVESFVDLLYNGSKKCAYLQISEIRQIKEEAWNMNDLRVQLELLSNIEEKQHEHSELELIYVIEGTACVEYEQKKFMLGKEDILLINTQQSHSITAGADSLVCKLCYSYFAVCQQLNEDYILFRCNSITEHGYKYTELNQQMKEVLLEFASNNSRHLYKLYGLYHLLLAYVIDNFKISSMSMEHTRDWKDEQKLAYIKNYISEHYETGIKQSELAQRLYLSQSTLSRYFVKMTGESFVKYVRKFRLQKVVEQLLGTEKPMTRIALDNGFSSPSMMNHDFKDYFGITPGEYREKHKMAELTPKGIQNQQQMERLKTLLDIREENRRMDKSEEIICADTASFVPYKKWRTKVVNVGDANVLKNAEMQKHVLLFKEKLGIEYVRIWTLFSEQLIMADETFQSFNFYHMDTILDFCVNHGIKMFLDFGPRTYIAMSSEKRYLYRQENNMEFSSEENWIRMMEAFLQHIRSRYGEGVVSSWIFEFTFFLNARPYYVADSYSSRRVWKLGYEMVKRYLPDAKTAGPGLRAGMDLEDLNKMMEDFCGAACMPDIFTSYNFPYQATTQDYQYQKVNDNIYLEKQILDIKSQLEKRGFTGEYYVTDWNISVANRNFIQDSCYRGTFYLKSILDNYDLVDEMGIWYASDILNQYYDSDGILSGSAGLVSKDGICKPAFYALSFLQGIGTYKIVQGENYIITRDRDEKIYILCFNNKSLGMHYYLSDEDAYKPDEVAKLFVNQDSLNIRIELTNLQQDGEYTICQKIVNEQRGSILNRWQEIGGERHLNYEMVDYLKQTVVPEMKIEHLKATHKKLQLNLVLEPHEMRWIAVTKD